MSKENFNQLMNQYSAQAEGQQLEETLLAARAARNDKIKQVLISVLVVALLAFVFVKHAELRDTVAKLLPSSEPEYKSILAVADEVKAGKTGAPTDPNERKARLKEAFQSAQNHAALIDDIMNDSPAPGPAPTPAATAPKKK